MPILKENGILNGEKGRQWLTDFRIIRDGPKGLAQELLVVEGVGDPQRDIAIDVVSHHSIRWERIRRQARVCRISQSERGSEKTEIPIIDCIDGDCLMRGTL
jgi:hypothetical protein